jgi:hypothetical protein
MADKEEGDRQAGLEGEPRRRRRYVRVLDEPTRDYFPAIIPTALYLKVTQARKERRVPAGPRTMTNLFQGLLSCGYCGGENG